MAFWRHPAKCKMGISNVAMVFGANLSSPPDDVTRMSSLTSMLNGQEKIFENLLHYHKELFQQLSEPTAQWYASSCHPVEDKIVKRKGARKKSSAHDDQMALNSYLDISKRKEARISMASECMKMLNVVSALGRHDTIKPSHAPPMRK